MAKRLLSGIVIIMLALSLNSMGCGIMNGSNNNSSINGIPPDTPNIAKVEGMSSSPFGLGVKLKPINAKADTKYIVDLEEKGNLRERTNITWNQPQINVRATQTLFFGLTNVEYDAYTTASMNDSNWWKSIFSIKIHGILSPTTSSQTNVIGKSSLKIISPNGSENWHVGEVRSIRWTSTNFPKDSPINIFLYTDSAMKNQILVARNVMNTGSYEWTVQGTATTHAKIQLASPDAGIVESANEFTISTK